MKKGGRPNRSTILVVLLCSVRIDGGIPGEEPQEKEQHP